MECERLHGVELMHRRHKAIKLGDTGPPALAGPPDCYIITQRVIQFARTGGVIKLPMCSVILQGFFNSI
ncbi:hypothetical protein RB195_018534 [Necator americanus]|uniref:Uncharacterized protein n=1 Tax=Necator americanus TaxID=51031 RepID=A0ABR1CA65_NECAM